MPQYTLRIPDGAMSLDDFIRRMPDAVRSYVGPGFAALAELSRPQQQVIARQVLMKTAASARYPEKPPPEIADINIPSSQKGPALAAANVAAAVIVERNEEPDALAATLKANSVVEEVSEEGLLSFLRLVAANRQAIQRSLAEDELAHEVLPSLESFGTAVDVRFEFGSETTPVVAPVIVAHLSTDFRDRVIFFQMTLAQARSLSEDLRLVLEKAERAQKWVEGAQKVTETGQG